MAHLFSALFEKTRVPDILPLVFIGLCLGPFTGLVKPEIFGTFGHAFTLIALVVIMFESGLDLNFYEIKDAIRVAAKLSFLTYFAILIVATVVSITFLGLSVLETLMLGSAVAATSAPIVSSLVSKLPIKEETRTTLILESAISDVVCILSCLAFLAAIQTGQANPATMLGRIIASFVLAALLGFVSAYGWSVVLQKIRQLGNSSFTTPAFVLILYGLSEMLGYSGVMAALAFGITLGNIHSFKLPKLKELKPISLNEIERTFLGEITFLLRSFFFVYLGISVSLHDWATILLGLLIVLASLLFRMLVVRFSMNQKKFLLLDASLASVVIPKGLAAAALASLIGQSGIANAATLQEIIHAVVLFSVLLTTVMTFLIERTKVSKLYQLAFFGLSKAK